jgi:flagellar assembly protein FliH
MSDQSSGFMAGFAARHDAAAQVLHQAFDRPSMGFAVHDLRDRAASDAPTGFSPQPTGPKHFSPANAASNPTEGWDPFDAAVPCADPAAAAHAAGYAEGMSAGLMEAGLIGERDRALLIKIGEALRATERFDREKIARQLRQTVLFLVSKLVGEIGIAADILARRIDSAADLLADAAESAMLRVHPDDVALLDGRLPASSRLATRASHGAASCLNRHRRSSRTGRNCGWSNWRR